MSAAYGIAILYYIQKYRKSEFLLSYSRRMLKSCALTVTALAGKFGHSSGTFGHLRGYIRSGESLNDFGTII